MIRLTYGVTISCDNLWTARSRFAVERMVIMHKFAIALMVIGLFLLTFEISAEFAAGDNYEVKPKVKITFQTLGWALLIAGCLIGR